MDEGMVHDLAGKLAEFLLGGELSPEHQVGYLKEGALFCEYFDGVSTILENTLASVDEGDGGGASDGVHVSRIVCPEHLALVGDLAEIA